MTDITAPLRLSLAGGGSDLPEHYERHGCRLLAVALTARVRVRAERIPSGVTVRAFGRTTRAEHPELLADPLIRAALGHLSPVNRSGPATGIRLTIESDVAPGSGLGGSGAFLVALVTAVSGLYGGPLDPSAAARTAFLVERGLCGRPVGQQDHWTAARGGAVELRITPDGVADARPDTELRRAVDALLDRQLLLLRTPITRAADRPLAAQAGAVRGGSALSRIQNLVDEFRAALIAADIARVGALLHEHWTAKRSITPAVSNDRIDRWYELIRGHGAYGAKLVGAGGGGHLLVATEASNADRLTAAMAAEGLTRVAIGTDPRGVRITGSAGSGPDGTGADRTAPASAGAVRAGPDRNGPTRTGAGSEGPDGNGPTRTGRGSEAPHRVGEAATRRTSGIAGVRGAAASRGREDR
ncbi:hypothetical protein [Streptomyces sp. CAU 1734]|uniref:GHMP family kinase ATP-binding protein n=1 Tax=Streptomyces sp. CAU 1734 TaxID=3140360 RepID=UPI003260AA0E